MSKPIFSDGIGYEGKVTLTLKSNNRVLKSKIYKNNGTAQLFKFLGYCLIGSYEEAKQDLPYKLMLLKNRSELTGERNPTGVIACSTWQTLSKTPSIIQDSDTSVVRVLYSFEIPKASIAQDFNQVALYGVDAATETDFSAYYYLTDDSGALEDELVSEWSATTVLLIEWELSLSNKQVEIKA